MWVFLVLFTAAATELPCKFEPLLSLLFVITPTIVVIASGKSAVSFVRERHPFVNPNVNPILRYKHVRTTNKHVTYKIFSCDIIYMYVI